MRTGEKFKHIMESRASLAKEGFIVVLNVASQDGYEATDELYDSLKEWADMFNASDYGYSKPHTEEIDGAIHTMVSIAIITTEESRLAALKSMGLEDANQRAN